MISPKFLYDMGLEVEEIRGMCRNSLINNIDNYINIMSKCVDLKKKIKTMQYNLFRDDIKKPFITKYKKI